MFKLAKYMGWSWALLPLSIVGFALEAISWWNDETSLQLRPLWFGLLSAIGFIAAAWSTVSQSTKQVAISHELLASVLDTLDVGLEIWDAKDRLVLFNHQINQLRIDFRTPNDIGKTFEALVRAKLAEGQIVAAIGREEEWLANRLRTRGKNTEPQLKEYTGDQWFKTREQRTSGGFLVTYWVDVTDLVRNERSLKDQNAQLQQQSSTDALTGLANRRHFDQVLAMELARADRNSMALSLLMVDIDHFKLYNDYYGHLAGDECLKEVAEVLRSCVRRGGEVVTRFGGEEFIVLLPGSDQAHATEIAQKCLDALSLRAIEHMGSGISDTLTFSIGVASTNTGFGFMPGAIVNAADAAMYRAKVSGRARYELAQQADWDIEPDTPRTTPAELNRR